MLAKWSVGQGNTLEKSLDKLKQAIESLGEVYKSESEVYLSPISIN
jgi:predicted RNase H-like HicB family nuclease